MSDAAPLVSPPAACAACRAPLAGRFCSACGARRPSPDDERLGPFLREQWQDATSADGKLWATIKALVVPGELTAEYFAGRRDLYVRPVRIFLVVNVILFFILSGADGSIVKGPLHTHANAAIYGDLARSVAESRARAWGTDLATVAAAFDARARTLAPSLIGVLVPGFALAAGLALWPIRASGVRHLVFATHTVTALVATMTLLMLVLSVLSGVAQAVGVVQLDSTDRILEPTFLVAALVYVAVAVRRVYRVPPWGAALAGLVLSTAGLFAAFWLFRLTLFVVTMGTLDPPEPP